MKKIFSIFFVVVVIALAGMPGRTMPTPGSQDLDLKSGRAFFDGNARVVVFYDHVVVTNFQGRLACERLTVNLPPNDAADSHPTNAVAETNVDIIYVDNKGETNHLVADKGIYLYSVAHGVTNETFTFTGHASDTTAKYQVSGEPLVWNNISSNLDFGTNPHIVGFGGGTNGSLLNLMK